MRTAHFYLLDEIGDASLLPFICEQVCAYYREGQKVLVMATDQIQAEALDQLLWQLPVKAFVPHNLSGEGPSGGSPVEISWPGYSVNTQNRTSPRPCLVNLAADVPDIASKARSITDVVPVDDQQRAAARQRYKQYRQLGIEIHTQPAQLSSNS